MKFKSLTLENFRVFHEKQTIIFNTNGGGNITLIGGLNGSGKTSLLTTIQILLYKEGDLSEQQFQNMLNGTLNNHHHQSGGRSAKLCLEIEDNNGNNYQIIGELYYDSKQNFIKLIRKLKKGNRFIDISEVELQNFIDKNIPSDVSSFFLFDGEKIQELVDKQEHSSLKGPIQKIMSIELYKKTLNDIQLARKRLEREYSQSVSSNQIERLETEIDKFERELTSIENKYEIYDERRKKILKKIEQLREVKNQKISKYFTSKDNILKEMNMIESKINFLNIKITEFAKGSLPLMLLYPIIEELKNRINIEYEYLLTKQTINVNFKPFNDFMKSLLSKEDIISRFDSSSRRYLYERGREVWAEVNNIRDYKEPKEIEILHDLNNADRKIIENFNIDELNITEIIQKKQELERKLDELIIKNKSIPAVEDFDEEDKKIQELNQALGKENLRLRTLEAKRQKVIASLEKVRSEYTNSLRRLDKNGELMKQLNLLNKVYKATDEFVKKVTDFKARCIKEDFENIINKLFRKNEDFSKIEFDVNSYSIKIYNHNGTLIRLTNRSAGEKQIIALSLIWALTKNASIDLPYVIDTPLGRLDSIHRRNLMEYYFPYLSEQVIILSTDTEVNKEFNDVIKEHISKSYKLHYDQVNKFTKVVEGYFDFE